METDNNYPYDKRVCTKHLKEPLESFNAFNIWVQHPNWTLRELSNKTNIDYHKILVWSSKYKYFKRRADKEAEEWKVINKLLLEAKMAAVKHASARSMKLQQALNARAEVTNDLNIELYNKVLKENIICYDEISRIDHHTLTTFKIDGMSVDNIIKLDDISDTIEFNTDSGVNNEFKRLSIILEESREKYKDNK